MMLYYFQINNGRCLNRLAATIGTNGINSSLIIPIRNYPLPESQSQKRSVLPSLFHSVKPYLSPLCIFKSDSRKQKKRIDSAITG